MSIHDLIAEQVSRRGLAVVRRLRQQTRHDGGHYAAGMRFRRESWNWSSDQKQEWTLRRLRQVIRTAYSTTDYYRQTFDDIGFDPAEDFSFEDFAALPVLERGAVQERRDDLISTMVPRAEQAWNATGGSSGQPVEIFMGPEERGWRASGSDFSMRQIDVQPGIRRALLWGHHLDPVTSDGMLDRALNIAGNRRWFDCLRLSPERLRAYHRELQQYQPRCLVAYASALYALARVIHDDKLDRPQYPSRRIVTGAEKLFAEQRALVEAVFDVPVHERYGSRDVGDIGFQYEPTASHAYRVDWALVFVEPATPGRESDILITKLHGDAMPMIRYRTDDTGIFPDGSSPGVPTLTLPEVLGRRADRVYRPGGQWVHGIHFPHLMKEFPITDFQVRQARDYSVEVAIVLRPGPTEGVAEAIRRNLAANLPDVALTVVPVESIARTQANKWRPVVTLVEAHS